MNTTELVDAVAEANDISKAKAKEIVNSILAAIIVAAKRGEEVAIAGLADSPSKSVQLAKGATREPVKR